MKNAGQALLTLEELGQRVSAAMAGGTPIQRNRQVTETPTERTIRYYRTVGLLDPPIERRGLRAMYGERHVLQMLAIKRLQAKGLSLREVRARLGGLRTPPLKAIACPPDAGRAVVMQEEAPYGLPARRRKQSTARASAPAPQVGATAIGGRELAEAAALHAVRLTEEMLVLFPASRPLSSGDIAAMRAAAAPLIEMAHARGLLPRDPRGKGRTTRAEMPCP